MQPCHDGHSVFLVNLKSPRKGTEKAQLCKRLMSVVHMDILDKIDMSLMGMQLCRSVFES